MTESKGKAVPANPVSHDEIVVRQRSLELAIDMVRNAKQFSNFQVIHTANSFAAFIFDGTTPPQPEPQAAGMSPEAFQAAVEKAKQVFQERKAAPEKFEPKPLKPGVDFEDDDAQV